MRILVVSHIPLFPVNAGNRVRMFNMFEHLKQLGCQLSFLHLTKMHGEPEPMRQYFGGRFHEVTYVAKQPTQPKGKAAWLARLRPEAYRYNEMIDDWYDDSLQEEIGSIVRNVAPDVVLVEYVMMSKALLSVPPGVLKVIDTHDLFGNRYKKFKAAGLQPRWFSAFPRDEIRGLNRADKVIAIQDVEARYLRRRLGRKVTTVGHLAPVEARGPIEASSNDMLFVGGSNEINKDAMRYFLHAVLPRIREVHPSATLLVVGAICNEFEPEAGLRLLGEVEYLADIYRLSEVVVNPCRFGTGLKTKNIEALAFGRCLVTTPHGALGMGEGNGVCFDVGGTSASFARKVCDLLSNWQLRRERCTAALGFAEQWHGLQCEALQGLLGLS